MSKRKTNPLAKQPFFIQFAYLPLNDEGAISEFLELLKQEPEIEKIPSHRRFYYEPSWQKEIRNVIEAWHDGEVLQRGIEAWLQHNRPQQKFFASHKDLAKDKLEEEFYEGYVNLDLRGFLIEEIIENMVAGKKLQRCEASDCGKLYIPTPRGRNQRFCSKTCYHRIRKRAERAKK